MRNLMTKPWTWNGEPIRTVFNDFNWKEYNYYYAILDGYDPTPYDADTPAKGPHTWHEFGESPEIAATNLIQRLYENI